MPGSHASLMRTFDVSPSAIYDFWTRESSAVQPSRHRQATCSII